MEKSLGKMMMEAPSQADSNVKIVVSKWPPVMGSGVIKRTKCARKTIRKFTRLKIETQLQRESIDTILKPKDLMSLFGVTSF